MNSTDLLNADNIEEIDVGLPPEAPAPAGVHETCEVSRYLLQETRQLERLFVRAQSVDALLADAITGFRRLLGCSEVELWLHDPIGRLNDMVRDWSSLYGMVRFTPDSSELSRFYNDKLGIHSINGFLASDYGVLEGQPEKSVVYMVPLIESGVVVGSLHCADPKGRLLNSEADLDLLYGLVAMMPLYLERVIDAQIASELMLLDPVTHVPNRSGLERDLDRELGRARRSNRPVSAVAIRLCGLEDMDNLSQRHIKESVLRKVTAKLAGSLRTTDVLGRIANNAFGVVVAEAPPERVADIAARSQRELHGAMVDNDLGGIVELKACASYVVWAPEQAPQSLPDDLAHKMFDVALAAADCNDLEHTLVVRAEPPSIGAH